MCETDVYIIKLRNDMYEAIMELGLGAIALTGLEETEAECKAEAIKNLNMIIGRIKNCETIVC